MSPDVPAPFVAVGALCVVILICRWVFSTGARDGRAGDRVAHVASPLADYGLLVTVATVSTEAEAAALRDRLLAAQIRTTRAGDRLLVFPADAGRARELVGR